MTCSLKPQFRFSRCEKGKGHHVLRFFHNVCYDKFRNECTDFYWRFCLESLQSGASQAISALYANLANALFARF